MLRYFDIRFIYWFCCLVSKGNFQALNKRLLISNDSYMRTTSAIHKETSQRLWKICAEQGDIFLGKYEVRPKDWRQMEEPTAVVMRG